MVVKESDEIVILTGTGYAVEEFPTLRPNARILDGSNFTFPKVQDGTKSLQCIVTGVGVDPDAVTGTVVVAFIVTL